MMPGGTACGAAPGKISNHAELELAGAARNAQNMRRRDGWAVAHSVALVADNQRQTGNSCPGRRLDEAFSQAQIAITGSRKQVQGRTFKPAAPI